MANNVPPPGPFGSGRAPLPPPGPFGSGRAPLPPPGPFGSGRAPLPPPLRLIELDFNSIPEGCRQMFRGLYLDYLYAKEELEYEISRGASRIDVNEFERITSDNLNLLRDLAINGGLQSSRNPCRPFPDWYARNRMWFDNEYQVLHQLSRLDGYVDNEARQTVINNIRARSPFIFTSQDFGVLNPNYEYMQRGPSGSGYYRKRVELPKLSECAICTEKFSVGDEVLNNRCSHWFHEECAGNWIKSRLDNGRPPNCPTCRAAWPSNINMMTKTNVTAESIAGGRRSKRRSRKNRKGNKKKRGTRAKKR